MYIKQAEFYNLLYIRCTGDFLFSTMENSVGIFYVRIPETQQNSQPDNSGRYAVDLEEVIYFSPD